MDAKNRFFHRNSRTLVSSAMVRSCICNTGSTKNFPGLRWSGIFWECHHPCTYNSSQVGNPERSYCLLVRPRSAGTLVHEQELVYPAYCICIYYLCDACAFGGLLDKPGTCFARTASGNAYTGIYTTAFGYNYFFNRHRGNTTKDKS